MMSNDLEPFEPDGAQVVLTATAVVGDDGA
jgi:hypothetical protein